MLQVINFSGDSLELDSLRSQIENLSNRVSILEGQTPLPPQGDDDMALNQILSVAPNWTYQNLDGWMWRSNIGGEMATGALDIGYMFMRNKLILFIAGGGDTYGENKLIQFYDRIDNSLLASFTLKQVLGVDSNSYTMVQINTSSFKNKTCWVRFDDKSNQNQWGWIGFDPVRVFAVE